MLFLLLASLGMIPQVASANAGTPLMWAGMLHLVFGNALIGIGEGLLIAFIFKCPKWRCISVMTVANYVSAWFGKWALIDGLASQFDWNLYTAWKLLWLCFAVAYAMTLLLEFPFVAACFWRKGRPWFRILLASFLVQTVSYILLFGWYWGASGKSLYTKMNIVPPAEIPLPANLQLFYIAARDGRVYEGSRSLETVASTNLNDRLLVRRLAGETNRWELSMLLHSWRNEDVKIVTVRPAIDGRGASAEPPERDEPHLRPTWLNFGNALPLDNLSNTNWEVWTGYWPIEGLELKNTRTGHTTRFAWETPFSQWNARNAILLPDDKVIFQFGEDQICVLEPATKKIALLIRGRGPAVLLK